MAHNRSLHASLLALVLTACVPSSLTQGFLPPTLPPADTLDSYPSPWDYFGDHPEELLDVGEIRTPDLNHDGLQDLIFVSQDTADPLPHPRTVAVYSSWPGDPVPLFGVQIFELGDSFGHSVQFVADYDGDGHRDVLISAPTSALPRLIRDLQEQQERRREEEEQSCIENLPGAP